MMTKIRSKCGIKEEQKGSKIKGMDKDTKKERNYTFVKEIVKIDDAGNIIGVVKLWR